MNVPLAQQVNQGYVAMELIHYAALDVALQLLRCEGGFDRCLWCCPGTTSVPTTNQLVMSMHPSKQASVLGGVCYYQCGMACKHAHTFIGYWQIHWCPWAPLCLAS